MKAQVKGLDGSVMGEIDLPAVFAEEYRPDLIRKAVIALQSTRYQPHGTYVNAGVESVGTGWGSGRGASHVPRLHNGSRAVKVPQARGGRAAHPPKVTKILTRSINKKERSKAIRSAIAATVNADRVRDRGHLFEGDVPVVMDDAFEHVEKTRDLVRALSAVGVYADVEKAKGSRKVRAGRGKMRGRRFKQKKSLLIVTADEPLAAARNLAGVDAVPVGALNAELLAPGAHAGRLTVWTESAVRRLEDRS
ncbi:MAG: 50S ribosomal protein L4 [Methanospirillum sp.]|nr:50S ribosomal protein L4 [Methanospirillum sp.]